MFTKTIGNMRLTNGIGDKLFPNINHRSSYRGEMSFLTTARALLGRRVPEGEEVILDYSECGLEKETIENSKTESVINTLVDSGKPIRQSDQNGVLHVLNLYGNEEGNECADKLLKEHMDEYLPGFREVADLGVFVSQKKMNASFYMNEERKSFFIIVWNLDIKKWHFMQAFITRYFPWYFKDNPPKPDEVAVIKSLANRYAPEYERAIEAIAATYNFRDAIIRDKLDGFETVFQRERLSAVKSDIRHTENAIKNLEREFSRLYQELDAKTTEEIGLTQKIENGEFDNEVMEYFLASKVLNLAEVRGSSIEFVVASTIDSYDPEVFESVISNPRSYFFRDGGRQYNEEYSDEQVEKLLKALFEEEIMKLRIVAAFTLDFQSGSCSAHSGYNFGAEFADYLPNMHLQRHSCLGSNYQYIHEAMMKRDYIGAFESCIASAKNMNMADSIVAVQFMRAIFGDSNASKIIQMPDGSIATPKEAIAWLDARSA